LDITPQMLTAMTHNVLEHAHKHLFEARDILRALDSGKLSLDEKLASIAKLKLHIGIIRDDADRALLVIGD